MSLSLRDYQVDALAAVADAQERGIRRPLIALPTGCGKTLVFGHLVAETVREGGTALILAHRDELLQQAEDKLLMLAPDLGLMVGRVQAKRNDVGAQVVVGSVQTLASEKRLAQLPPHFDLVVVDECHHATAESYRRILDHVDAPVTLGVTATPERHDKSRLADVFEEIIYARSLLQMIQDGYLANLKGVRIELADLDLSEVKSDMSGDYQAGDLGRALHDAHAPEHTAAAMVEHAADRKSIVFVPTIELAQETARAISAAGIPAAAVWGDMVVQERHDTLEAFSAGEIQAAVTVDVLSEGYDEPSVDCVVIAAPTRSRISYSQRVGRGTRLYPGKQNCLVLDMVGVTDELDLQSLPALFELDAPPKPDELVTDAIERETVERAKTEAERELAEAEARKRRARSADLFNRDRMHWLHIGERWAISAGTDRFLVLDPVDSWRVLLLHQKCKCGHVENLHTGDGCEGDDCGCMHYDRSDFVRVLARNLDLGYAQGAAEEAIRSLSAVKLADAEAAWRSKPVSRGQYAYMRRLGIKTKPADCGEASDLINTVIVTGRLDRAVAAVEHREAVPA